MLRSRSLFRCAVVAVALGLPCAVSALTIDFAGLNHGGIFDPSGYQLTVDQNNSGVDLPVIFDSHTESRDTSDHDLLFGQGWATGNIARTDLGNLLILQESDTSCGATSCSDADDSARGGLFSFDFGAQLFTSLSFALVDIDDVASERAGTVRLLLRQAGQPDVLVTERRFDSFAGIGFGNRSANEFALSALDGPFNVVEFRLASSGAVGELDLTPVPEPSTAALTAVGLLGLAGRWRRRTAR